MRGFIILFLMLIVVSCSSCSNEQQRTIAMEPQVSEMKSICELATMDCYYHNVARYKEEDAAEDSTLLSNAQRRAQKLLEDYVNNIEELIGKQYKIKWIYLESDKIAEEKENERENEVENTEDNQSVEAEE